MKNHELGIKNMIESKLSGMDDMCFGTVNCDGTLINKGQVIIKLVTDQADPLYLEFTNIIIDKITELI